MVNSQTENYLRLLLLNVTGATPLLRETLESFLRKCTNKTLAGFLNAFKNLFETLKKKRILNLADYNKLLGIGTSVDVNEWDTSLLCFVLINCCTLPGKLYKLKSILLKAANNDLNAFALLKKSNIETYKGNGLSDKQYSIIFPANSNPTNIDLWDMELITFILTKVCTNELQKSISELQSILQDEIDLKLSSLDLAEFLKCHEETLKNIKAQGKLEDSQYEEVFPSSGAISDINKWDTHTLRIVVLHCTSSVSMATIDAIKTIRKVRNECLAHTESAEMINSEYYSNSTQLKGAIETIILEENLSIKEKIDSILKDVMDGPIDMNTTLEVLKDFYKKNSSENGVILSNLDNIFQQIYSNHAELLRRFDRLEKIITPTAYSEESVIKCVDMIMVVRSKSESGRKKAEDTILNQIKTAGESSSKQIKAALLAISEIIKSDDRIIVEVKKGSIILTIKCISIKGLHRLLQYVVSDDMSLHLLQLSSAMTDFVGESVNINVYMSEPTVLNACQDVVGILSNYVDNTISLRMTLQAETVEELQQMLDEFKGESFRSQLRNVSEGLSTYIGEDINVDVVVPNIDVRANTTVANTDLLLENRQQTKRRFSLRKMAGLQPTLSDTDFENWVKAGLSLQYTKDGIENFADTVIGNLHQSILNTLPSGVTCTNCTTENIVKCERNNNFCRFAGRACVVHDPYNISKRYRPCPSNVCDKIRDIIITNHRYNKPAWQNTDARLWCTNRWKISVCYMSVGYSQTTSASETDLPGLLNVIINNTYFQTYITDNLSDDNNIFRKARTSRNDILHNPRQRLTYVELRAHIAKFTAVLSDVKSLSIDTNAIAAITKLQQIVNNTISITTQHAGQILAEAFNSIKDAVDDVKDLKETTIKYIVDKMKEIDRVSDEASKYMKDALESLKETNDEITENIKKKGEEAVKPITDAKDNALDAIKGANDKITENIKTTGKEAVKPISDAKENALDAIKGANDKITENIKTTGKEAIKPISDAKDNALDAIKGANDKITENIKTTGKEAIKPISDAKDNALDAIKGANDKITENIKTTGKEAVKPISDAKDNALDAIKGANDKITENIKTTGKEAVKPISDAKDNALDAIKGANDTITEKFKTTRKQALKNEKRTLKRIAKEEEKSLGAIKKTKHAHIKSITKKSKQLTIEHSEALIEKKNELVAEITNKTNKDRPQDQSSITEIRQELVSLYQTEARFLTTPLYPLIQNRNRNIEDLYVSPSMRTVHKETLKPEKEVNSLEDIFHDNSKNIYVVGDAGMGKSALCKKIVSDWCKSKSENETPDMLSTDQIAMHKFSFVFYISLRDSNTDLKIIDMIEEICECDDKTLKFILQNEKCLIVLDGLDEWTPKVTPNTTDSSYSSVNKPSRDKVRKCSILTTTRPWKLEAIRLESSQIDKQIELLGIGEDSHKAFIKHMVKQMDPEIDSDYFLSSFLVEVENKNLDEFISIPVILKQLVCIWRADNRLRKTKSSTYSQMLNLLFKIAQSRLQDNANYKDFKSTATTSNIQLPECFAEDEKCKELGSLLCPLSKVAFETLLSDTPESTLVFEMSTIEVHGLTQEQLNICLDIGILSQTKYFSKRNYMEENTKISFLHKTYQEFLAALWISLETNEEIKQTNIIKFKNKCNTMTSIFELSEFLIFVSGMNSNTACELSEHTREITTTSDIIREYRQSVDYYGQCNVEVERVQKLMISCIKEGWECTHSDSHLYLEDIVLGYSFFRGVEEDIAVKDRLIKINKSNIKSIMVGKKFLKSHNGSLLEVSGLEKLMLAYVDDTIIQRLLTQSSDTLHSLGIKEDVYDDTIIQRLLTQSSNTLHSLGIKFPFGRNFVFKDILQNIRCLTRLHLEDIYLSHIDMVGLMSYISQTHHMKEIELDCVECDDCDYDKCSTVLDLSRHDQLDRLCLESINVTIDTVVNVTNMVKCELGCIQHVMTFVNVTKSLHNTTKLTELKFTGCKKREEVCAMVECISHLKHIERLQLLRIDFGSNELVLSSDYRNLEYVRLHGVTMTKRSFSGVIDSILACNQAVCVDVVSLHIKPVEDIKDILDNVRQSSTCQVMKHEDNKEGGIWRFDFKTIPRQHT